MVSPTEKEKPMTMIDGEEEEIEEAEIEVGRACSTEQEGKGTWKHAAFHVATTIATPAAYAPLPFALASLGWPLGNFQGFSFFFLIKFHLQDGKLIFLVGAFEFMSSGVSSLVSATLATWYSSLLIASLWRWNGKKQITYRHLAKSIFG